MRTWLQELRYAARQLRKSPGFTVAAVITLALAIGANAVVFGVLDALVLRPLNVPQAESLWGTQYGVDTGFQSYPNYVDLRDRNHSFEDLAAFNFAFVGLDIGKEAIRANGFAVTGNYFDVLRIRPHLGNFFHASDEHGPNSAPFLVLSYPYWHSHFQSDPSVIGRTVQLNKHPFTIVGITPPEFGGTLVFVSPDFYMPIVNQQQVSPAGRLDVRGTTNTVFEAFGHLKPGVTAAQAVADLEAVSGYLEKTYPNEFAQRSSTLGPVGLTSFQGAVREFMAGLMVLAALVLLAGCANLGGLFAARAADRAREVALRLALGSSRKRILRGLFTEAILISFLGATVGLWGGIRLLERLNAWQPFSGAPVHVPTSPDAKVYLLALVLALVSALLFGLVPVRQVLKSHPYEIVKAGSSLRVGPRITMRDLLLGAQIAICALLVTSSIVSVRGLMRSLRGNFGFEPRNTVMLSPQLAMAGYTADQVLAMQKRIIHAVEAIPGVQRVGLVNNYPPLVEAAAGRVNVFQQDATDLRPSNLAFAPFRYEVSPEYFSAAATALVSGRAFSWHDDDKAPPVAVVNREFARMMFGSVANSIGRYFKLQNGTRVEVVGVVEDGKYLNITEDPQPAMFLSFLQWPDSNSYLVVRSTRDTESLAAAVRDEVRKLDRGVPVDTTTWTTLLDVALFPARMATLSLGVLGLLGAMLSITGIFGLAAYSVSKRLRELGIRIALGARRAEVLEAALGRPLKLLAFGSAAGLVLGVLASRLLASIVYSATPRDPIVLVGSVFSMAIVGAVATWIPARRALSVDPMRLLREE
jgi:predicted permease